MEKQLLTQIKETVDEPKLRSIIDEIAAIGKAKGVLVHPPSPLVFEDYFSLPFPKQDQIYRNLAATVEINREEQRNEPDGDISLRSEVNLLRRALDKFGYIVNGEEVFSQFNDGDILEVYNAEGIQIYRSWSFFKFCSYSLIDLLVYDWNTLYERPAFVVESLMRLAPLLFQPGTKIVPYDIPPYMLTERFLDHNQAFNVKMKLASPILDKRTGITAAFISTASVKSLDMGEDKSKLKFL